MKLNQFLPTLNMSTKMGLGLAENETFLLNAWLSRDSSDRRHSCPTAARLVRGVPFDEGISGRLEVMESAHGNS